jgi:hypothetical protein
VTRLRFFLPILVLYLLTRLLALHALPIFLDETVHLRWAFNISEGDKLFRPWGDGRLLTIWLYAFVLPRVRDFLWVARALSGAAGALTLFCLLEVGRRLVSPLCGRVAALLYVFCPFTLFYDRLALTDSFLTAGASLTLLLSLRALEEPKALSFLLLALALAASVLTKFSGILFFLIPPISALLMGASRKARLGLMGSMLLAGLLLSYPLFIFAGTDMLKVVEVQARDEGLLTDAVANVGIVFQYLSYYWGPGLLVLGGLGLVLMAWRKQARLLAALTLLPLLIVAVTLRVWFARYILWETVPFLLLAGLSFSRLFEEGRGFRILGVVLLLGAVLPVLPRDARLVFDPPKAGLPPSEAAQYVNGWPSGYGVRETVQFLGQELKKHPEGITVVTHSAARRTTWNALDLYFQDEPSFDLEALDFSFPDAVPWLVQGGFSKIRPTYVILSPRFEGGHKSTVTREALAACLIQTFQKPDGSVANEIYLLDPRKMGSPAP